MGYDANEMHSCTNELDCDAFETKCDNDNIKYCRSLMNPML